MPGSSAAHASSSIVGTLKHTLQPAPRPISARRSASRTDHRPLGDDGDRRAAAEQSLESAACELVVTLDRLIRVRGGTDRNELAFPGGFVELAAEHLDQVGLHEDQRRELVARPELELRLVAARKAVVAAVRASAVRVECPVERHPFHAVQRRPARHFLIAGVVGPSLCPIERRRPALLDRQRDGSGRWRTWRKVEERSVFCHVRLLFAKDRANARRCQAAAIRRGRRGRSRSEPRTSSGTCEPTRRGSPRPPAPRDAAA